MKKIISFFIAMHCILLQGTAQFDNLNELHKLSKVKRNCEQLQRAWFFQSKSKKEIACDSLDHLVGSMIVEVNEKLTSHPQKEKFKRDLKYGLPKILPYNDRLCKLITKIVPEKEMNDVVLANELDALATLILHKTNVDPAKGE